MKRLILGTGFFLAATCLSLFFTSSTSAVSGADWRAGNIINDTLFTDGDGMSVSQIQDFLKQRLPSCDIYGTKPSELGGGTRAQYGASVGNPAPFTCLTNYYEVPKTSPGSYLPVNNYGRYNPDGSSYVPPGSKSAAQLIYDASKTHSINPKALLIKLATESKGPLTSDSWPLKNQYYYAMGAHCPDSGPGGSANCNINYAGFSIQISEAAALLRSYLDGMTQSWWPYKKPFITNSILWNVAPSGCGAGNVYIETKATAALYTYTPYQPNQAALNNLYGTGDGCSAYGNRNFWRVWNDWFGSTNDAGYTPFFQFSGSVTTYVMGANNSYYVIDDYERLKDYGFETSFRSRTKVIERSSLANYAFKGTLPAFARFENSGIFVASGGKLNPFPSESIFHAYGYDFGQEAVLAKEMKDVLPQGDPLWQVVAETDGTTTYYIDQGKKRALCNWDVFTQLGSPVYSNQPRSSLKKSFLATIPVGGPIAMEGDVIEAWGTNERGVWQGSAYHPLSPSAVVNIGSPTCGAPAEAVRQLPRSQTQISNFIRSSNTFAILDRGRALTIAADKLTNFGLSAQSASVIPGKLLDRIPKTLLSDVVRVDNAPAVFLLTNSKRYGIPSEADLRGLGYDFSNVQSISRSTFDLFPDGGLAYKPGALIREQGSLGVYLVSENLVKHPFVSEQQLYNYGYGWNTVSVIPSGATTSYTVGSSMLPFIREGSDGYWIMDSGSKRRISADAAGESLWKISSTNSIQLPVSVLRNYPMKSQLASQVFKSSNNLSVYVIQNGLKRGFTSEDALFRSGYTWSDVQIFGPSVVDPIPLGAYIY